MQSNSFFPFQISDPPIQITNLQIPNGDENAAADIVHVKGGTGCDVLDFDQPFIFKGNL